MPIEIDGEIYYTAAEAMAYLGISRDTFYRRIREQTIPRYEQGIFRRPYYRQSDLDKLKLFYPRKD